MKVYLWENDGIWLNQLVLWDGVENTYWTEEMLPSFGYYKMPLKFNKLTKSRFTYIGKL